VETTVDLANKTIRWSVGESIRATYILPVLGDHQRTFRPYIELLDTYDTVELIW
jgi:hypothetical protein